METKVCNKCGVEKNIDNFREYSKHGKKYIQTICKKCENKRNKEYAKKHVEEIKEYKKQWVLLNSDKTKESKRRHYELNIDKIKKSNKKRYEEKKDEILAKNKIYRENNSERLKKQHKEYYSEHKEDIVQRTTEYKKNRIKIDPVYKFESQLRHLIGLSFSRKGFIKSKKTEDIVGIDLKELYTYLLLTYKKQYGYEWDRKEEVHIDHIIPLATAKTEEEVLKLCHYTNLQLLKAKDNLEKNDRLDWKLEDK